MEEYTWARHAHRLASVPGYVFHFISKIAFSRWVLRCSATWLLTGPDWSPNLNLYIMVPFNWGYSFFAHFIMCRVFNYHLIISYHPYDGSG